MSFVIVVPEHVEDGQLTETCKYSNLQIESHWMVLSIIL
jgi:hypothetical protein